MHDVLRSSMKWEVFIVPFLVRCDSDHCVCIGMNWMHGIVACTFYEAFIVIADLICSFYPVSCLVCVWVWYERRFLWKFFPSVSDRFLESWCMKNSSSANNEISFLPFLLRWKPTIQRFGYDVLHLEGVDWLMCKKKMFGSWVTNSEK